MKFRSSIFYSFLFLFFLINISCNTSKKIPVVKEVKTSPELSSSQEIQEKYAEILKVEKHEISSPPLYLFIDKWYGTAYEYAGKSKQGIDCSGFASLLYKAIYNKDISGASENILSKCKSLSREELKEGDFVFFKIDSNKVSHVGVYLQNSKFVHSTIKAGVIISDLNEIYYSKYYYCGGRVK